MRMRRIERTLRSTLAISVICGQVLFQESVYAQDQTIRVTTRLVQVVAIVRDKKGPVADLTKKDFEITDGGKPRQIATFSVAKASERVRRSALPPNVFTNRLDQNSDPPVAATVLLFDRLNTQFADQATARKQILGFLKSLDPQSPVAIYGLGNQLRILQDFTDDPARLTKALEGLRNGDSPLLRNSTLDGLVNESTSASLAPGNATTPGVPDLPALGPDELASLLEPMATFNLDRRVSMTLSAMMVIANRMGGVPGRKNLIWISGGFPLAMAFDHGGITGVQRVVTYAGPMKDAAIAIDRANVAIYPVDARGLQIENNIRADVPTLRDQRGLGQTYNLPTAEQMAGNREIETMKTLAEWTGGKAFYNTNDVKGAVKQATEDAEVTYTLGFYVDEKELDSNYHDLKVKVARKGLEVRHRKGYFASALPAAASQTASDILLNAVFAPVDATGIGLTATVAPNPESAGSYILALALDLQTLRLEERNGKWVGGINFGVIQQARDGKTLDTVANSISINITDENHKTLMKDGLVVRLGITPAPGMSQIRAAVMDQLSGNAGSLRVVLPAK